MQYVDMRKELKQYMGCSGGKESSKKECRGEGELEAHRVDAKKDGIKVRKT